MIVALTPGEVLMPFFKMVVVSILFFMKEVVHMLSFKIDALMGSFRILRVWRVSFMRVVWRLS